ncbi:MAG: signal peptidase II [Microbacteriaceae bacterium]|nr:signal peptidase II [Microbacteriaceae bacterium]
MRTRSKTYLVLGLSLFLVFIDQLSKFLIEDRLSPGESINIIGDLLRFTLIYNDSAAFSLGVGATWPLTIISSIAVLALIWFGPKSKSFIWLIISALVLGGATGNLIDRLFREPGFANGHVVDFLQIPFNFPIFNLADSFVVIGVSLALIRTFRGDELGGGK